MPIRRSIALLVLAVLLLGPLASPALADTTRVSVSQQFETVFAPGAKITRQESAVAISRLMGMESEWSLLTTAEIHGLLENLPDMASVDLWARPAVAGLVKLGVLDGAQPFHPLADATRLDVAVLLVKALGYEAEAQREMSAALDFRDAHLIPAELQAYVATAVDRQLITGYVEEGARTFRPHQAVKRVEMAIMLSRADQQIGQPRADELEGTVKAVSAAASTVTIALTGGGDATVRLADDAAVFINDEEKSLADLIVGMAVEVKLNPAGLAIFVEARGERQPNLVIEGVILGLNTTSVSIGYVASSTFTMVTYPVASDTAIFVNGQAGGFNSLQMNDSVRASLRGDLLLRLEVTR